MIETSVWVSLFVYPVENLLCQIGCVRIALLIMKVSTYWGKIEQWIVSLPVLSCIIRYQKSFLFWRFLQSRLVKWKFLRKTLVLFSLWSKACSFPEWNYTLSYFSSQYVCTFITYFTQFFGHYYKLSFSREEQKHFSFSHFLTLNFFQIT